MADKKPTSGRKEDQKMKAYLVMQYLINNSQAYETLGERFPGVLYDTLRAKGSQGVWYIIFDIPALLI